MLVNQFNVLGKKYTMKPPDRAAHKHFLPLQTKKRTQHETIFSDRVGKRVTIPKRCVVGSET